MARTIMRAFKLAEISAVDRPAQKPARMAIMKRDDGQLYTSIEKGDLDDAAVTYLKREFTAEERERAASSGAALPDGSFPIENAVDLHNAMRAVGRAKNQSKAKAHIRERAKALGLETKLTDAFKSAPLVEKFMALFRKTDTPSELNETLEKSTAALAESVASIVDDDAVTDKASALSKTFAQFYEYLAKALAAGGAVISSDKEQDMSAAIKKALGLAESATEAEVTAAIVKLASAENKEKDAKIVKLESELAIAKAGMDDDEKKFHDGLKDDDAKAKFRGASKADRKVAMTKRDDLPEDVRKALAEHDDLKKKVAVLEDGKALEGFTKSAIDIGLPEAEGATLQKAYRGDKEAVDKLVGFLKAAHAQAKAAGIFKEIGGNGPANGATALDELNTKADELRKKETGLSQAQAFAKVYADPANAEIVKRERAENRPTA
jgi:hypothetical protein